MPRATRRPGATTTTRRHPTGASPQPRPTSTGRCASGTAGASRSSDAPGPAVARRPTAGGACGCRAGWVRAGSPGGTSLGVKSDGSPWSTPRSAVGGLPTSPPSPSTDVRVPTGQGLAYRRAAFAPLPPAEGVPAGGEQKAGSGHHWLRRTGYPDPQDYRGD